MTDKRNWTAEDMPDLSGKVAVVTGANSGIGFETPRGLARKGAHVVLASRDEAKGTAAMRELQSELPQASLELMTLDLADLSSVRSFAEAYLSSHDRLDILVNNAGVMAIPYRETADGFEMQFGTNHLGHFALTGLLLPVILDTPGARVVTVSSGLHRMGKIELGDLHGESGLQGKADYSKTRGVCEQQAGESAVCLRAAAPPGRGRVRRTQCGDASWLCRHEPANGGQPRWRTPSFRRDWLR